MFFVTIDHLYNLKGMTFFILILYHESPFFFVCEIKDTFSIQDYLPIKIFK